MKMLNITDYCLKTKAHDFSDKPALLLVNEIGKERQFTYAELYDQIGKLAAGFNKFQLPKASIVCIYALDVYDLLLAFLAANAANLVPVMMLPSLVADGVQYILHHSNARLFIQLKPVQGEFQRPQNCHLISAAEFAELKNHPFEEIHPSTLFNDPAFIFYTSGSSGQAKGVLHAQHTILGRHPSLQYWLTLNSNDIVLQTDNLCWTYSMFTGFLDPLMVGATALVYEPSNASSLAEDKIKGVTWLQLIEHYRVTVLASTADFYNTILNDPHTPLYKLPSLRMVGSAGSLLPEITQKRWQATFHMPIYIALGMTEISTFISTGPTIPYREQTIGKIQPGRKVRLLPIEGGYESVPLHTMGMLAVHKEELGLMLGYLGESHQDKNFYRGDWFLTQDLLSMDEEGYLTYYGRMDSILKVSGGFRVSPTQVENVIKSCDQVKDAACTSQYDEEQQTDILVAYIVSESVSEKVGQFIHQQIAAHLSDYKMPSYFYFVEMIPYTSRGKLIRSKLQELTPIFTYFPKKMKS